MAGEDPPALCCDDCDDAESRRETFMSIAAIDIVFGHWIHNLIMFPPLSFKCPTRYLFSLFFILQCIYCSLYYQYNFWFIIIAFAVNIL